MKSINKIRFLRQLFGKKLYFCENFQGDSLPYLGRDI